MSVPGGLTAAIMLQGSRKNVSVAANAQFSLTTQLQAPGGGKPFVWYHNSIDDKPSSMPLDNTASAHAKESTY